MNKKYFLIGILFLLPIIVIAITYPLEIENEIILGDVAVIDSIIVHYMIIICLASGLIFIAKSFDKFASQENNGGEE